ncbi:TPA: hypothetical protein ACH3X3_002023 [Trebouxia sp. C0006]
MKRLQVLSGHFVDLSPQNGITANPTSAQLPGGEYKARTGVNSREEYEQLYKQSLADPAAFWGKFAQDYYWQQKFEKQHVKSNFNRDNGKIEMEFFRGGKTNIAYNCLDRHVKDGRGDQPCFLWEGNELDQSRTMTYKEVLEEVSRLGNWLRSAGIKKGDAVAIYMPLVCELPIAMLACARIGAVHSVVFGGFSAEALAQRIQDCKARVVLTAAGTKRGAKKLGLKQIVDRAVGMTKEGRGFKVEVCLVLDTPSVAKGECPWVKGRDVWWQEQVGKQGTDCKVEWMNSEDPLFLLYTSGSTGNPKGVLHTTGGYMVMAGVTTKYVFDLQPGDVYWCTADCGWITGHTYLTYGPLLNGAQNVIFEGVPTYPDPSRCWQIVEKHKVRTFYTAPTLIRALEAAGDKFVTKSDLSSLRILGTVGEPINAKAWNWYNQVIGGGKCPIVDTWWQTETGAILLTPLPGAWNLKPGSATLPFFGVEPVLLDDKGKELQGEVEGILAMKQSWPSIMRTLYGDHKRYEETYFSAYKGYYFTGDGCKRDEDGYFWITGRVDDVINVSGHRVGTAEVEGALVSHDVVDEAAVCGVDHNIKGQGIYAYVVLAQGTEATPELKKKLNDVVRNQIGSFAVPDTIHWAPGVPKTRSGKIMRRILRKIASKQESEIGDTSTLADPLVVDQLLETRGK